MHRILNAVNVLTAVAFLSLIGVVGTVEWAIENDGSYWRPIVLMAVFAASSRLLVREDGKKR